MAGHGIAYPGILDIVDAVFLTGLPDDLADGRIVYMGYLGEEVVFNLEIESAYQPAHQFVMCRKISGGFQLVNCPLVVELAAHFIGHGEGGMFHGMGQLEYNAQYKAGNQGENQETDQPGAEAHHVNRQSDK